MVGTHVRTDALVVIDTAVSSSETRSANALASLGITVSVVTAVIQANFNLASNTSISDTTVASALKARSVTAAQIRAVTDGATRTRESWLAGASSVVTISIDTLGAELGGAIRTSPSGLAVTDAINTLSTHATLGRAVFVGTLLSKESRQAIACAVVAISVTRAVGRAGQE